MFRLRFRSKPTAVVEASAAGAAEAAAVVDAESAAEAAAALAAEDADGDDGDERRTTPRRDVPLGPAVRVEFMLLGRARSLNVDDVSLGGLGLRGSVEEGRGLFLGQKVPQARVMVGDQLVLVADLEVRIRRSFRSFLAGEQVHIGCRFLGLNPLAEAELQRLLAQLIDQRGR
ncbi:PilZ domain-containing protein [Mitsuaria sp. CC2]|uniref:hypothetical protein n=1 Tax=Mitsuaria sp. CC2 TaxID=3029186 RepID=UPI003B8C00D3